MQRSWNWREKKEQLQGSTSSAEKHIKELDDPRTQQVVTRATADSSSASAQSAQLQCLELQKELDDKKFTKRA